MRIRALLVSLALLSIALLCASVFAGSASLDDAGLRSTLVELRLLRGAVAYLTGAALAVGGVIVQGLFRNPLASPDILGTSAGASFAGKLSLFLFQATLGTGAARYLDPEMFLPVGCLIGAFCALLILLRITRRSDDAVVLLLSGFLLSALFLALGTLVMSVAQESWEVGRAVIAFALGSVTGAGLRQLGIIAPIVLIGTLSAMAWSRPLDLLLSGEDEAHVLGLDVKRARRWCIAWTALLTAGAVAVGGNIGFVGLVVPHGLRRFAGVRHKHLVPAAALGGGCFVLACDMLTRLLPTTSELPLGVITGLIGAPLFLYLLFGARSQVARA